MLVVGKNFSFSFNLFIVTYSIIQRLNYKSRNQFSLTTKSSLNCLDSGYFANSVLKGDALTFTDQKNEKNIKLLVISLMLFFIQFSCEKDKNYPVP